MTTTPDVDWAAVEQRGRRVDLLAMAAVVAWFGSMAALTDGLFGWSGTGARWVVAGYVALFVLLMVLQRTVPALRRNVVVGRRVQYGMQHHVDPGPGAREKADLYARRQARLGWVVWTSLLLPVAVLANGRWDRPAVAVPAALVFLTVTAAAVLHVHRQVRWAQRWVADPPGPAREVPAPTAVDRWTSGRRLLLAGLGVVLVGVVAGVLVGLLS